MTQIKRNNLRESAKSADTLVKVIIPEKCQFQKVSRLCEMVDAIVRRQQG
jgi:hypothetical protein